MSVYRRDGIWHFDLTIAGRRYRGSTLQRGKAAALKVEAKRRAAIVLGEDPRKVPTLREAADRWVAARVEGRDSQVTTARRVKIMLRLMDGEALVSQIDTPDIEEAMQSRRLEVTRQGRAPTNSTVNRDLIDTTLRPILRYCKRTLKAPVNDIDWPELRLKEPEGRTRTFTPDEMADWTAQLPEWHRPIYAFVARYGLRLREAFFALDAVEAGEVVRVAILRRKGRVPHVLPLLAEDGRDITARLGRARAAGLDTVWFRELKSGRLAAVTWRGFQSASSRALERAGVADARPVHDLRHHAATAFLRATGNLKATQRLLGHRSIASTARYAHVDDTDVLSGLRHAADTTGQAAEIDVNENSALAAKRNGT